MRHILQYKHASCTLICLHKGHEGTHRAAPSWPPSLLLVCTDSSSCRHICVFAAVASPASCIQAVRGLSCEDKEGTGQRSNL